MDVNTLNKAIEINRKMEALLKILDHQFPHSSGEVKMTGDLSLNQVDLKFDATVSRLGSPDKLMGVSHQISFSGPDHNRRYWLKIVGHKEKSHDISFSIEEAAELKNAVEEFNTNIEEIISGKITALEKELDSL